MKAFCPRRPRPTATWPRSLDKCRHGQQSRINATFRHTPAGRHLAGHRWLLAEAVADVAPEEFGQETVRSKAKNAIIFHVHGQGLIISPD